MTPSPTAKSNPRHVLKSGAAPSKDLDAYGAVLKNTSKQDARDVSLIGSLVDSSRTIISGVTPIIPVIPAGATYYWATVPHEKGTRATRFEVTVKSADFSGTGAKLPLVGKVKLRSDGYNTLVSGRVTNNVGFTLSQIAPINVVFFDAKGRSRRANGYLDADLPKGGRRCSRSTRSTSFRESSSRRYGSRWMLNASPNVAPNGLTLGRRCRPSTRRRHSKACRGLRTRHRYGDSAAQQEPRPNEQLVKRVQ